MESTCIFCKIAAGEIPSTTLYEDADFRVIFDIAPASFGHAIILPKRHAKDIYELSNEDAAKIFVVAKKVATALEQILGCDGVNILQNNGEAAGQTVFHLHVHIIPRYKNDTVTIGWKPLEADMEKLKEVIKKLTANNEAFDLR
ncbi:MAG: histidine triad family protein [Clostridiales bacterium]|nr:histidine triad family protein [Clostridiales bacterium]